MDPTIEGPVDPTIDGLYEQLQSARLRLQDLYKRAATTPSEQALLEEALEELSISLEELHVSVDEMRQFHQELAIAHDEIATEHRRYQELFDFAPAGYVVTDPWGIIQDANRMAEGIFAASRDRLVHKPLVTLIVAKDHKRFRDLLERLQKEEPPPEWQTEIGRKSNPRSVLPVSIHVFKVCNREGRLSRLLWLVRDVTERKNAERVVHQALCRVIALRDINDAIMSTLELQDILSVLLERIEQFFPYPVATTVRLLNPDKQLQYLLCRNIRPEDWQSYGPHAPGPRGRHVIETKAAVVVSNVQIDPRTVRPNFYRTNNLVAYVAAPLIKNGEVLGILGVYAKEEHEFSYEEVSFLSGVASQAALAIHNARLYQQLKEQSAQLQHAHGELERRVEQRTAELARVNEELRGEIAERQRAEDRLRQSEERFRDLAKQLEGQLIISNRLVSVGELAASFAHEFNNPLAIILGLAQEMRLGPERDPDRLESVGYIEQEALRCRKIVLNFLDFARPAEAAFVKTDIGQILQKTVAMLSLQHRHPGIETTLYVEPDLPSIFAEPQQLQQVLLNLTLNAVEAMPQGGTLTVRAVTHRAAGTVRQESIHGDLEMTITVADTGIGMDAETLSEIFRPFFTTKKNNGMGLGLSICERIVKAHRGKITVESALGQGTTFTLRFPVAAADQYDRVS